MGGMFKVDLGAVRCSLDYSILLAFMSGFTAMGPFVIVALAATPFENC